MDFLENLGSGISRVGSNLSQRTKDLATITSLNAQNSKLKKNITEMYVKLGQQYYELYHDDPDESFSEFIAGISSHMEQIEENNRKIAILKSVTTCPSCGAEIQNDTAFCPVCGKKMEQVQSANATDGSACPSCGIKLSHGQQFCHGCGAKIAFDSEKHHIYNAPTVIYCPECGKQLRDGAKFCSGCGYRANS